MFGYGTFAQLTFAQSADDGGGGAGTQTLIPSLYVDADTFYIAVITAGVVNLLPSLFIDGDTFYSPTVTAGTVTLLPNLYTDIDTFYTPVISVGGIILLPSLFIDGDVFYTHLIEVDAEGGGGDIGSLRNHMFINDMARMMSH